MSIIRAEYALGNSGLTQFKGISGYLFEQLKAAFAEKDQIHADLGPRKSDGYERAKLAEDKIRAEAPKYVRRYNIILREYKAFERKYSKILERGKDLEDWDYRPSLWEIIADISREEACTRHMAKYKDVYDMQYKLLSELAECRPYIFEHLQDTIAEARRKAMAAADRAFEDRLRCWNEEHKQRLASLEPMLKRMQGYMYLIRNLCIETEGGVSTVSGLKIDPYKAGNNFGIFREAFVNQAITLSR